MASKDNTEPSNTDSQAGPLHEGPCASDQDAASKAIQLYSPNHGPDKWYRLRLTIFGAAVIAAFIAALTTGFPTWQGYIAQDRARRQLRAYIVVRPHMVTVQEGIMPRVQSIFENTGQTPAYSGGSISRLTVADYPLTKKLINDDCRTVMTNPKGNKWFVGKVSQPATVRETPFIPSEITAIKDGNAAVYFHGRVCYLDLFNESHRTNFCMYWKWQAGQMSPGLYCDQGNSTD
jgi:hypothetical protein